MARKICIKNAAFTLIQLMSPWTSDVVFETISRAKELGYDGKIGVGGNYASLDYIHLLNHYTQLDFVIVGEAEAPLLELAKTKDISKVKQGLAKSGSKSVAAALPIENLDELPFASRPYGKLLTNSGVPLSLSFSRGCYRRCEFCTVASFSSLTSNKPKWRSRSAKHVFEEILILNKRYGADQFAFVDDNFIGPKSQDKEVAREFAGRMSSFNGGVIFGFETHPRDIEYDLFKELVESGLAFLAFGFESGSQAQLRRMRKGSSLDIAKNALDITKSLRIPAYLNTILIDDRSSLNELHETINFIERNVTDQTFNLIGHAEARIGTSMFERVGADFNSSERKRPYYRLHDEKLRPISLVLVKAMRDLYALTQDIWRIMWLEWRAAHATGETHSISSSSPSRIISKEKNDFSIYIVRKIISCSYGIPDTQLNSVIQTIREEIKIFIENIIRKIEICYFWIKYTLELSGKNMPVFSSTKESIMPNLDNSMINNKLIQ